MRHLLMLTIVAAMLAGCGSKLKKLSEPERAHYYALKVYMSKDVDKAFFKFKTEEERNAFLKSENLWDRFYKYDAETRQAIIDGEVEIGWAEDQVLMSWGKPYQRLRMTSRPAERSELFVYRFEVDTEGVIRLWTPNSKTEYKMAKRKQVDVYIDDLRVTEMNWKEFWE